MDILDPIVVPMVDPVIVTDYTMQLNNIQLIGESALLLFIFLSMAMVLIALIKG